MSENPNAHGDPTNTPSTADESVPVDSPEQGDNRPTYNPEVQAAEESDLLVEGDRSHDDPGQLPRGDGSPASQVAPPLGDRSFHTGFEPNLGYLNIPAPVTPAPPRQAFPTTGEVLCAGSSELHRDVIRRDQDMVLPIGIYSGQSNTVMPQSLRESAPPLPRDSHRLTRPAYEGAGPHRQPAEPTTPVEARHRRRAVLYRPSIAANMAGLPDTDLDRHTHALVIANAMANMSSITDGVARENEHFQQDGGIWTRADMITAGFEVVEDAEMMYHNGSTDRAFRFQYRVPAAGGEDDTLGFEDRINAFARLMREYKHFANYVMQGQHIDEYLSQPNRHYERYQYYMTWRNQPEALQLANVDSYQGATYNLGEDSRGEFPGSAPRLGRASIPARSLDSGALSLAGSNQVARTMRLNQPLVPSDLSAPAPSISDPQQQPLASALGGGQASSLRKERSSPRPDDSSEFPPQDGSKKRRRF
ncbi:hypothetical protein BDV96DRAFT_596320 [Lophiotrema nucula]|uniref:Uncharacterized protein n=1 Tax=Lophiotrema nucula TaxID=690887 RepID=A0A6A5ZL90_9PLEO|nr:hypothetical protein BDV96DRAFT_596320 [Lophiotrema nucula]